MTKRAALTIAAAALICLCAGCGAASNTAEQGSQTAQSAASDAEQTKMLEGFRTLLSKSGAEKDALAEMSEDMPSLSKENAAVMLLAFEDYQEDALAQEPLISDALAEKLRASAEMPYSEADLNDPEKIKDEDAKAEVQAIVDRGYKIIVPEGMYQAIINYSVYRQFESSVTDDMAAYIEIEAEESDNRTLEDAGIIIPISDVYERACACEDFLALWPQSQRAETVSGLYKMYVDSYFYGQNNTPAFDYETNALNQEFRDSYETAAEDDTAIGKAVAEYLKVLEKSGYKLTDDVSEYRGNLVAGIEGK
ncbi:MAG: hypothetical protein VB112_03635 [Oscillospiraceae bacterium]|nr:hypothetical protein [Oscillospiraceae bacterium]